MSPSRKKLWFAVRLVATASILALLLRAIGWTQIAMIARDAKIDWVLATYMASFSAMLLSGVLLWRLLRHVALRIRLTRVWLANALSTLYTLILPGDLLAGTAKWVDLSAATGDRSRVFSAMVLSKIGLAVAPLAFGTAALAFENPFETRVVSYASIAVSAALVIGIGLYLSPRAGHLVDRAVDAPMRLLPRAVASELRSIGSAFAEFRSLGIADSAVVFAYSIGAFVLGILAMKCAAIAVGANISITVLAWVSMILFITRLLPITISNLGIREGVLIATLGLYGVAPAAAFAIGIIMFGSTVLIALVGAGYQIAIAAGWIQWRGS